MKVRVTFEADRDLRCAVTAIYTGETNNPASHKDMVNYFRMHGESCIDDHMTEWQAKVDAEQEGSKP